MATMTVREVPDELHSWLKKRAEMHHRSMNKEVIALLEKLRGKPEEIAELTTEERFAAMMAISRRCAALPELDPRGADEIVGYDQNGLPE